LCGDIHAWLFGLPLANYFLPEFMERRVLGFTLTWLILGISFFPAVWLIAFVFIRRSLALEEDELRDAFSEGAASQPAADCENNLR
jgi:uncharacterized membrane protein (DUF485 family)